MQMLSWREHDGGDSLTEKEYMKAAFKLGTSRSAAYTSKYVGFAPASPPTCRKDIDTEYHTMPDTTTS
jgi:hypothetical protein